MNRHGPRRPPFRMFTRKGDHVARDETVGGATPEDDRSADSRAAQQAAAPGHDAGYQAGYEAGYDPTYGPRHDDGRRAVEVYDQEVDALRPPLPGPGPRRSGGQGYVPPPAPPGQPEYGFPPPAYRAPEYPYYDIREAAPPPAPPPAPPHPAPPRAAPPHPAAAPDDHGLALPTHPPDAAGTAATPIPADVPWGAYRTPEPVAEPPVVDQSSRPGTAPWRLAEGTVPAALTADGFELGELSVRAASVIGPSHRCLEEGKARQDAYLVRRTPDGRHLVIAVADGVSQAKRSDLGARVAVTAAARLLVDDLKRGVPLESLDAAGLFRAVAGEMVGTAQAQRLTPQDVVSILVVAVIPTTPTTNGEQRIWTAQIGDVSVWRFRSGRLEQFTGAQQKQGMDKNVLPHVLPFHFEAAATTWLVAQAGDVVAVVTDGVSETIDNVVGGRAFFQSRWSAGPRHPAVFLHDLCYDAPGQIDDRTAVVVWFGAGQDASRAAAPA